MGKQQAEAVKALEQAVALERAARDAVDEAQQAGPVRLTEFVRWVRPSEEMPKGDEIVLVVVNGAVTRGFHESAGWFEGDGLRFCGDVQFWAKFPSGPQDVLALEAQGLRANGFKVES